jgi:hypothetical protein
LIRRARDGRGGDGFSVSKHREPIGDPPDFLEKMADINDREPLIPQPLHDFKKSIRIVSAE